NNVSTFCNNNQPNSPLKKLATLSIRSGSTNFLAVLAKKSTTPDARSPNVASLFDGEMALTAAFLASTKTSWAFCNILKKIVDQSELSKFNDQHYTSPILANENV
uniref:Uncharacterized protein n=1 Tax=Romanomermis culicivorax TaxID=13658 RepID=A0A915K382_ROMCU